MYFRVELIHAYIIYGLLTEATVVSIDLRASSKVWK